MNDAEYAVLKGKLEALIEKWREHLGLGWWRCSFVYERNGIPAEEKRKNDSTHLVVAATCDADWRYMEARISFDMTVLQHEDDDVIEKIFVHECCHVLVDEMRCTGDHTHNIDHEERVVSSLQKAFLWVYKAGRDAMEMKEPVYGS